MEAAAPFLYLYLMTFLNNNLPILGVPVVSVNPRVLIMKRVSLGTLCACEKQSRSLSDGQPAKIEGID